MMIEKPARQNAVYIAGFILLALVFIVSLYKYVDWRDTKLNGQTLWVEVKDVNCSGGKTQNHYFVFRNKGKNHIVLTDPDSCRNYEPGRTVPVLYLDEAGIYYSTHHTETNSVVA